MGGENNNTALLRMLRHTLSQSLNAVHINGGKGFIEDPQSGAGQPQTGQRHAPLLSGGKLVHWDIFISGKSRLRQRSQTLRDVAVMMEETQVLQRRKPGFYPRLMSNPQ